MDYREQISEAGDALVKEPQIRREVDSLDDFEHLGHDNFGQKDVGKSDLSGDIEGIINKRNDGSDSGENPLVKFDDDNMMETEKIIDDTEKEKFDKFFQDSNKDFLGQEGVKTVTYDFMEAEKGIQDTISKKVFDDSPVKENLLKKEEPVKEAFSSVENLLGDDFRDVEEEFQASFDHSPEHVRFNKEPTPPPAPVPSVPSFTHQEFKDASSEKPKPKEKVNVVEPKKVEEKAKNVIEAEVIFCKIGLDTWFNPEKLNPQVEGLIYWRDPKKSGPVFGGVLLVLLALTYFSLISVIAYLSLFVITGTISFRVYRNVVQAVQKTGEGHPFKEFLEFDLSLPPEKVKEISEVVVAHVNAGLIALRRLFLVEDLIDSIKFAVFMWTLTHLGAWFNGMTLVILAWVALFTLPKVYETNKTQIDANLEIVKSKLAEITSKVKAAIPLGKKEEKKE